MANSTHFTKVSIIAVCKKKRGNNKLRFQRLDIFILTEVKTAKAMLQCFSLQVDGAKINSKIQKKNPKQNMKQICMQTGCMKMHINTLILRYVITQ